MFSQQWQPFVWAWLHYYPIFLLPNQSICPSSMSLLIRLLAFSMVHTAISTLASPPGGLCPPMKPPTRTPQSWNIICNTKAQKKIMYQIKKISVKLVCEIEMKVYCQCAQWDLQEEIIAIHIHFRLRRAVRVPFNGVGSDIAVTLQQCHGFSNHWQFHCMFKSLFGLKRRKTRQIWGIW